jgi:hypothetical protein
MPVEGGGALRNVAERDLSRLMVFGSSSVSERHPSESGDLFVYVYVCVYVCVCVC